MGSLDNGTGGLKVQVASTGGWVSKYPAQFKMQEYDWTYSTDYSGAAAAAAAAVRDPTTWTIRQQDGPNHLGLWYNMIPE